MASEPNPQQELIDWLNAEMDRRHWSIQTLADRAGVAAPTIWNIVNGRRSAGPDVLRAIAGALDVSQVEVFTRAKLIDEIIEDDQRAAKVYLHLLRQIPDDDERERIIDIVEALLRHAAQKDKANRTSRTRRAVSDSGTA